MRIISDFKDYYDSAQSFGSDPNLTYVRKQESFEFESRFSPYEDRKNRMPRQLDRTLSLPLELIKRFPHVIVERIGRLEANELEIPITVKLIGFCGTLYPAIEIDGTTFYSTRQAVDGLADSYLIRHGTDQKAVGTALGRKVNPRRGRYWCPEPLTHGTWGAAVADVLNKRFEDIFVELAIPAFKVEYIALNKCMSIDKIRCTLNPFLKADEFQKVRGPADAFQEISMYLGNQLARQPDPISRISDEVLRDEKGFDKWSFRRHKEEDKKYRKKRRGKGSPPL